jgi:hypothetical protein
VGGPLHPAELGHPGSIFAMIDPLQDDLINHRDSSVIVDENLRSWAYMGKSQMSQLLLTYTKVLQHSAIMPCGRDWVYFRSSLAASSEFSGHPLQHHRAKLPRIGYYLRVRLSCSPTNRSAHAARTDYRKEICTSGM